MHAPRRLHRRRGPGWKAPTDAIFVGRPTAWGNPFRVSRSSTYHGLEGSWFVVDRSGTTYTPERDTQRSARQCAVDLYEHLITSGEDPDLSESRIRAELAGHDLVCWCPRSQPCHVDVLLVIANSAPPAVAGATDRATDVAAEEPVIERPVARSRPEGRGPGGTE